MFLTVDRQEARLAPCDDSTLPTASRALRFADVPQAHAPIVQRSHDLIATSSDVVLKQRHALYLTFLTAAASVSVSGRVLQPIHRKRRVPGYVFVIPIDLLGRIGGVPVRQCPGPLVRLSIPYHLSSRSPARLTAMVRGGHNEGVCHVASLMQCKG